MNEIYTAEMGNPPADDDMMSIEMLQGKRKPMPKRPAASAPAPRSVPRPAPRPNPADANVFTADKGIQPPTDDEGPTMSVRPKTDRQKKAAKDIKTAMGMKKGGSVGSASKRADGCAKQGKTKGRII